MKEIIIYGITAAFFFSSTFAINRWLNEVGHWYWTATLRYIYVFIFLSLILVFCYRWNFYKETIKCFYTFRYFWFFAGGIGFGVFYLLLCFAASYSAGWVLATTWQITILMSPLVILLLGSKVPFRGISYLIIMFLGILLVNHEEFLSFSLIDLKSVIPISIAAFCYPFGNTLCKYASEGKFGKFRIDKFSVAKNVFSQMIMMTLGAAPILIICGIFVSPPPPTINQLYYTAIIGLFTGVIATALLYIARQQSKNNPFALAAADGTQAGEPPLALFWEHALFNQVLPSITSISGLAFVIIGILFFYKSNVTIENSNSEQK